MGDHVLGLSGRLEARHARLAALARRGEAAGHLRPWIGREAVGQLRIGSAAPKAHLAVFGLDADIALVALAARGDLIVGGFAGLGVGDGAAGDLLLRLRAARGEQQRRRQDRSEEHTSELPSLMRISYAVFCLKTKTHISITSIK